MHKIIHCIELAENIMCIYRNYLFCRKKYKTLILLRILIEAVFYGLVVFSNLFSIVNEVKISSLKYFDFMMYTMYFGDIFFGFLSKSKCASYKVFIDNLTEVHNVFKKDVNYIRRLKRLSIILFVSYSVSSTVTVYFTIFDVINNIPLSSNWGTLYFFYVICTILRNELTYILEFMALYAFLSLLTHFLKCLNSTLSEIQKNLQLKEELNTEYGDSVLIEKLTQWAELYKCLVESAKQLSAFFNNYVNVCY